MSRLGLDRTAFTLVELVFVIVIISILSSIALPRFSNAIARQRANATAKRIVADLKWARTRARTTSLEVKVKFEKDKSKEYYRLVDIMDPDHPDQEFRVYLGKEPYLANIIDTTFGNEEAKFQPDGTCNGGQVEIHVGNEQRIIVVDPLTGKAALQ